MVKRPQRGRPHGCAAQRQQTHIGSNAQSSLVPGLALMDGDDGSIARGEGGGGIYRVLRDCPVSQGRDPDSERLDKLRKKDEIVVVEWCLLASPPVMRIRSAEGWCTERDMDGGLNIEHVHGRKVGQTEAAAVVAAAGTPPGRRKSVSVMTVGEKQALRRASVHFLTFLSHFSHFPSHFSHISHIYLSHFSQVEIAQQQSEFHTQPAIACAFLGLH